MEERSTKESHEHLFQSFFFASPSSAAAFRWLRHIAIEYIRQKGKSAKMSQMPLIESDTSR